MKSVPDLLKKATLGAALVMGGGSAGGCGTSGIPGISAVVAEPGSGITVRSEVDEIHLSERLKLFAEKIYSDPAFKGFKSADELLKALESETPSLEGEFLRYNGKNFNKAGNAIPFDMQSHFESASDIGQSNKLLEAAAGRVPVKETPSAADFSKTKINPPSTAQQALVKEVELQRSASEQQAIEP